MDAESLYWDQYGCEDSHITQLQQPSQLQATTFSLIVTKPQSRWSLLSGTQTTEGGGSSSRDSYWSRYSYTHDSVTDQCTPVYGSSIELSQQRQQKQPPPQQRLFVVPDRLATLHISTSDDEDHNSSIDEVTDAEPAFQLSGANHESRIVQQHAADNNGNEQPRPCDPARIASDSKEGLVPPQCSSPVSGFQGVNPTALITRLSFLKEQMEQNERLVLGTAAAV
ncbi:hypothetical protein COEREDRAFT_5620 [Coemansia reversa NRRL 1564]|uniref:Uncharacterized protein n=1 Tax=Coemansia reversa (strain ATCC 12441 / NRRL 1564) TaxID=763665 RepID=A0A2G5BJB1_COERN|nr:hypothetical protein COEREDRAFT_5620 [Coemansia reversa NRRL 1564]|eukprot:PIA19089.1 hypothetical protein COEREDRAFT_5620 [Coemansia reversa NRRL 1564]